ncbi:MAG: PLDc N-terminal domain-containing protein [Desulfuromonadales bacterium]|nr:PLDc N-terminal domain-containing protein [Desulfuromonadales bacterium]
MKTAVILFMLVFLSSLASAEVYRWEDANGVNFSDNPSSMPEKNREKPVAETELQPETSVTHLRVGKNQQALLAANQEKQVADHQANQEKQVTDHQANQEKQVTDLRANQEQKSADHQASLEQQRQAAETKQQQQIDDRNFDSTMKSLAKFVVIWIVLGLALFVVWIVTIVDIVRSDFNTPSNKAVWLLLVIFLPLLGMLFYMIPGLNRRLNSKRFKSSVLRSVSPSSPS